MTLLFVELAHGFGLPDPHLPICIRLTADIVSLAFHIVCDWLDIPRETMESVVHVYVDT